MADNKKIAADILQIVGGKENIATVNHCMTRLRLNFKDATIVSDEDIKAVDGVTGLIKVGGQYQIVIGQNVTKVYDEFCQMTGLGAQDETEETNQPKKKLTLRGVGSAILDYMSGSMTPVLPIVLAGGMFRAILALLGPDMLKVLTPEDSTYIVLNFVYEVAFYFMPMFLGYSAAKKLKVTPTMGLFMGAVLLAPTFMARVSAGEALTFLGLPIRLVDYSQSILPIMLCVWIMSYVEPFFKKHIPDALSTLFVPFLTMLVMLPVALIALAPLGAYLGDFVSSALIALGNASGFLGVAVLSALCQFLVMTGMHLVVIYAGYDMFFAQGYDSFILPCMAISFVATAGLALGAFLRFRNKKEKAVAGGYLAAALIGGVTEPTLYGIGLRYTRPLACMAAGGFAGGAYAGLTGVQYLITGAPAFLMPLTFAGGTTANLINGSISLVIAFAVSAALTFFFGFDKNEPALHAEDSAVATEDLKKITAPMDGEYLPQDQIPDEAFASGTLGQAIGIRPSKGEVIAPASGVITSVAESKHAVGMMTDGGAEILLHVGMDTVNLKGQGFKLRVKEGEKVLRGQLLIKYDLAMLKERGIETTSAMVITNADELKNIDLAVGQTLKAGDKLGKIEAK